MKRKLTMSVSRDVLESVEASQICFCNVNEDTIGWRRRQHYRQGFMLRSACKLLVGSSCTWESLAACHSNLGELLCHSKPQNVSYGKIK